MLDTAGLDAVRKEKTCPNLSWNRTMIFLSFVPGLNSYRQPCTGWHCNRLMLTVSRWQEDWSLILFHTERATLTEIEKGREKNLQKYVIW